jgi:hypothetical protein
MSMDTNAGGRLKPASLLLLCINDNYEAGAGAGAGAGAEKTDLITQINIGNDFFSVSRTTSIKANFTSNIHFANEIAQHLIEELDQDNQLSIGYPTQKYLNFHSKLSKLKDCLNDFHSDVEITMNMDLTVCILYIDFLRQLINRIVFTDKVPEQSQQSPKQTTPTPEEELPTIDEDGNWINRCIICRVDMGSCNPRQYCCKTYCPQMEMDG